MPRPYIKGGSLLCNCGRQKLPRIDYCPECKRQKKRDARARRSNQACVRVPPHMVSWMLDGAECGVSRHEIVATRGPADRPNTLISYCANVECKHHHPPLTHAEGMLPHYIHLLST